MYSGVPMTVPARVSVRPCVPSSTRAIPKSSTFKPPPTGEGTGSPGFRSRWTTPFCVTGRQNVAEDRRRDREDFGELEPLPALGPARLEGLPFEELHDEERESFVTDVVVEARIEGAKGAR